MFISPPQQRRKIFWSNRGHRATVDFGTRNSPDRHEVSWEERKWMEMRDEGSLMCNEWILSWGGMAVSTHLTENDVLINLIRMAYQIEAGKRIPSEILADAGLEYENGTWIDSWSEFITSEDDENIVTIKDPSKLSPPENRKIRLEPYVHIPREAVHFSSSKAIQSRVLQARSYPNKITHLHLEEEPETPKERIRFRDIGPEWEDPSPWYKGGIKKPKAFLSSKAPQWEEEDETDELTRRLQAAMAIHSSD